jgi:hypothetical protein
MIVSTKITTTGAGRFSMQQGLKKRGSTSLTYVKAVLRRAATNAIL